MKKLATTILGIIVAMIILSSCTVSMPPKAHYPHEGSSKCAYEKGAGRYTSFNY